MGEITKIAWCHHTFNPWIGCTKVAPECAHCYAEDLMAKRWKKVEWGDKGERKRTSTWNDPLKWNQAAEKAGERRRVFCASLADVFEDKPELVRWRDELFALIDATPWLDWLLLTKRPENIKRMWPLPKMEYDNLNIPLDDTAAIERLARRNNVWLGTSCGHPESIHRVKSLAKCRQLAPVLFVSAEPLLHPLFFGSLTKSIDWVIVGGESGPQARPCDIGWIRSIVKQCRDAEVPCFVKQLGSKPYDSVAMDNVKGSKRIFTQEELKEPIANAAALTILERCLDSAWVPIKDIKGGNPEEWPEDLRIREFPEGER